MPMISRIPVINKAKEKIIQKNDSMENLICEYIFD
jgi:hypothetical protein